MQKSKIEPKAEAVVVKKSEREETRLALQQEIRERTIRVTNQKAKIFDIIEDKSRVQVEIQEKQALAEKLGQAISNEQRVLEGERKLLKEKKELMMKEFPEITVEK